MPSYNHDERGRIIGLKRKELMKQKYELLKPKIHLYFSIWQTLDGKKLLKQCKNGNLPFVQAAIDVHGVEAVFEVRKFMRTK